MLHRTLRGPACARTGRVNPCIATMRTATVALCAALTALALVTVPAASQPPMTGTPPDPSLAGQPPMTGTPPDPSLAGQPQPPGTDKLFATDFDLTSIEFDEILSGGPEKDGIPPIDEPVFVSIMEADPWLDPHEPVILVELGGDARAYPVQVMIWHEIVNDVVGGTPVAVTYCPLCNTAIAFGREYGDVVYDFGTSGLLRFSNLLMYDRQTESWWQQATGEAVIGTLTGARLSAVPASIMSWGAFKAAFPEGRVLSKDHTGHQRDYGRNPYLRYDTFDQEPFLYDGPEVDERLLPMAHVLGLELGDDQIVYPYDALEESRAINDMVGGQPVVVFWQPGTSTPMEAETVADGRDIGAAAAFSRRLGERVLTFEHRGHRVVDVETETWWNAAGVGLDGPLAGRRLTRLPAFDYFWFAWAAFRPETRVYGVDMGE